VDVSVSTLDQLRHDLSCWLNAFDIAHRLARVAGHRLDVAVEALERWNASKPNDLLALALELDLGHVFALKRVGGLDRLPQDAMSRRAQRALDVKSIGANAVLGSGRDLSFDIVGVCVRFRRGDEAGPHADSCSARREHSGNAPTISDATRGKHGNGNRIEH